MRTPRSQKPNFMLVLAECQERMHDWVGCMDMICVHLRHLSLSLCTVGFLFIRRTVICAEHKFVADQNAAFTVEC